jgi:hypothetical protein
MTKFIMLIACALIIIPIFYFIPLRLSTKNKLFLSGLSIVLAIGGLFIADHLTYGTIVGAMLCFAFIAAYIIEKRMPFLQMNSKAEIRINLPISENAIKTELAASDEDAVKEIEEISVQMVDLVIPLKEAFEEAPISQTGDERGRDSVDREDVQILDEDFSFLQEGREELSDKEIDSKDNFKPANEPPANRFLLFEEIEEIAGQPEVNKVEPISEMIEIESLIDDNRHDKNVKSE